MHSTLIQFNPVWMRKNTKHNIKIYFVHNQSIDVKSINI